MGGLLLNFFNLSCNSCYEAKPCVSYLLPFTGSKKFFEENNGLNTFGRDLYMWKAGPASSEQLHSIVVKPLQKRPCCVHLPVQSCLLIDPETVLGAGLQVAGKTMWMYVILWSIWSLCHAGLYTVLEDVFELLDNLGNHFPHPQYVETPSWCRIWMTLLDWPLSIRPPCVQ